jgi:hypothetical protein
MKLFTRSSHISDSSSIDPKLSEQWENYCNLELIPIEASDRTNSKGKFILALMESLWQKFIDALTKAPELKIWQKQDRHGHIVWHAYDPWTGDSISLSSEEEMRYWIESRYHHH